MKLIHYGITQLKGYKRVNNLKTAPKCLLIIKEIKAEREIYAKNSYS